MYNQQLFRYLRTFSILWVSISTAVEQMVEKIMMPPQDSKEYIINQPLGLLICYQGRRLGYQLILIQYAVYWHSYLSRRCSYKVDYLYCICVGLITNVIPMFIISYFALSMGYISKSLFFQQILYSTQWFNSNSYYYTSLCLGFHQVSILIVLDFVCFTFKLNKFKAFVISGIVSLALRFIILTFIFYKNELLNERFRNYYDQNEFTQLYIYSFSFAIGEKLNQYQIQSKMIHNKYTKPTLKLKNENAIIILSVCLILSIIYVFFDFKVQFSDKTNVIFVSRLIQPIYSCLLLTMYSVLIIKDETKQQLASTGCDTENKFQTPGYNHDFIQYLCMEPLFAIILYFVGDTIIGPYNSKIFVLLTIGIITAQLAFGKFLYKMIDWLIQGCLKACISYFDELKRKHISQLIKNSIYTD
ncbi:Conserved_hypothetical protein [Hexamita inflata]|uniref:Uncharacterized protein n=1 Tax=Hexamita inflata TaxID=28002 RepID=A0AA86RPA5_9EUKA|nr:Conserved hypothetical protein [Hexamita inflata]